MPAEPEIKIPPTPKPAQAQRPDAVDLPDSLRGSGGPLDRVDNILKVAEPLLQVDRSKGERGWIRRQGDRVFVTRDRKDTLFHAHGTEKQGKPRYNWSDSSIPDVRIGHLVKDE